jgi:2'-5' RNA ligase
MAPLPGGLAEKVERYAGLVPDEDLYEGEGFGRADDPHVTLKFGLITRDSGEAARALRGVRPFAASLGRTFRFEGDEFDVIAAEARGEGLLVCHSLLSRLRNGDPHEDYVPHCTVAFVKPGACSWLDGDDALAGEGFTVRDVVFSDREGNEETFSLGAAQAAVSSVERESDAKPARHREFAQKLARDFFRERIAGGGEWIEEIVRRLREGEGLSRGMLYGGDPRRPGDLRDQYHEWAEENVDPADLDVALAVSDDVLFDAVKFIGTMDARAAEVLVRGNISGDFVFEAVSGLGALGSERLREGGFLLRFGNAELAKRAEDILTSAGLDARSW